MKFFKVPGRLSGYGFFFFPAPWIFRGGTFPLPLTEATDGGVTGGETLLFALSSRTVSAALEVKAPEKKVGGSIGRSDGGG